MLAPLLERLVVGRRVVVLGEATLGLATELTSRGARLVHVYDPDAGRAAQAMVTLGGRNIAYAPLAEDLGIRDGAFDVAILPDVSLFANPAAAIARARQLAGPSGLVVVGCDASPDGQDEPSAGSNPHASRQTDRNPARPGKLGYYGLYDALSLAFREVKMLGQVPFTGYALVDFGAEGDVAVSVDTSLADAGAKEPRFFLALGSDAPIQIDDYTIVELPSGGSEADGAAVTASTRGLEAELETAGLLLAEITARAEALRAEVESQRETRRILEARLAEEGRLKHELAENARVFEQRAREALLVAHETDRRAAEVAERLRVREAQAHGTAELQRLAAVMQQRVVTLEHELGTIGADLARAEEELRRAAAREQQAARLIADLRATGRLPATAPTPVVVQDVRPLELKLAKALDDQKLAEAKIVKMIDEVREHRALEIKLTKVLEDLRVAEGRLGRASEEQKLLEQKLGQALETQKAAEGRLAQALADTATEKRGAEQRANEQRANEQRANEQRANEQRANEQRANEQRDAQAKLAKDTPPPPASPEAEKQRKDLEARLAKALDERHVLTAQTVALVAQNRAIEGEKLAAHERLTRTMRELDTLQEAQSGDFIAGENVLRERAREVALLKREVERRGSMVKELLAALEQVRSEGVIPQPEAAENALEAEVERRRAEAEALARERATLLERLAAQGNETTGLAGELSSLRAEVARVTHEHGEKQRELTALRAQLAEATQDPQSRVATLEREVDTLRRALLSERSARLRTEETRQVDQTENERAVLRSQAEAATERATRERG